MNIPRPVLQRRRFIKSGSVLAVGALSSALAVRKLFSVPRSRRSALATGSHTSPSLVIDEPVPEKIEIDPAGELVIEEVPPPRPLEHECEYTDFLASLDLRHLSPEEIIEPHRGIVNGIENELPPQELWEKLAPTLKVADEIRERLKRPLCRITSAYRQPKYNSEIPGAARRSYHVRNMALDCVYFCSARDAYKTAVKLRNEGFFKGGIGLYPTFIHIDTRGYAATWKG